MRIGELSARTGVSRRSLRYYEQHGLLRARRSTTGWREYDDEAVGRAANVAALLARGLTIEGVKRLEPCLSMAHLAECDDPAIAIDTYEQRLTVLDERLDRLRQQRARLSEALNELRAERA